MSGKKVSCEDLKVRRGSGIDELIWHTTGSGKTLTSFKTAKLARGLAAVAAASGAGLLVQAVMGRPRAAAMDRLRTSRLRLDGRMGKALQRKVASLAPPALARRNAPAIGQSHLQHYARDPFATHR